MPRVAFDPGIRDGLLNALYRINLILTDAISLRLRGWDFARQNGDLKALAPAEGVKLHSDEDHERHVKALRILEGKLEFAVDDAAGYAELIDADEGRSVTDGNGLRNRIVMVGWKAFRQAKDVLPEKGRPKDWRHHKHILEPLQEIRDMIGSLDYAIHAGHGAQGGREKERPAATDRRFAGGGRWHSRGRGAGRGQANALGGLHLRQLVRHRVPFYARPAGRSCQASVDRV